MRDVPLGEHESTVETMADTIDHLLAAAAGGGLPATLPSEPFSTLKAWFDEAVSAKATKNPDAMALATVRSDGAPNVRIVLCKGIDVAGGSIRFFTNYTSAKADDLAAHPVASVAMLHDAQYRQIRVSGVVTRASDAESDEYFATRALLSRLGAWASDQSKPMASRAELVSRVRETASKFGVSVTDLMRRDSKVHVPRPAFWGGYRIHATRVELWCGGDGRLHDRAEWTRTCEIVSGQAKVGAWSARRLFP